MSTQQKAWTIGAVLALGGACLLFAIDKGGWQYGNVPEWFAAVGTVGALLASLYAIKHATDQAKIDRAAAAEDRREAATASQDALQAQARLVTVTTEIIHEGVRVDVKNHSPAPILAIEVLGVSCGPTEAMFRLAHYREESNVGSVPVLGPGEVFPTWLDAVVPSGAPGAGKPKDLQIGLDIVAASVEFVDAQGLRWRRRANHAPERRIDPPKDLPPNAFEFRPIQP